MFRALSRAWRRRDVDKRIAKHGWTAQALARRSGTATGRRKVHASQIEGRDGWLTIAAARRAVQAGRMFEVEAYQLVLSDETGRLPWEPGCRSAVQTFQPPPFQPFDPAQATRAPLATLMRM